MKMQSSQEDSLRSLKECNYFYFSRLAILDGASAQLNNLIRNINNNNI